MSAANACIRQKASIVKKYVHLLLLENPTRAGEDLAIQIYHQKPIRSAVDVLRHSSHWAKCRDWNLLGFLVAEDQGPGRTPKKILGMGQVPQLTASINTYA